MVVDVLLGLQWGDEGKGKIVDVLSSKYDVTARFQGGPNAGHTLQFNGIKHISHIIPSGIFHKNCVNIVGNGVVIDPVVFKKEIDDLIGLGVDVKSNILLSRKAHLILPTHRILDAASEKAKGKPGKIGTTLRGIGPAYMDKTGRNGLRVGDIDMDETGNKFKEKYSFLTKKHSQILSFYQYDYNLSEYESEWFKGIECIRSLKHIDSEYYMNSCLIQQKSILAEGAQGTLLDIDFGSYPYVTSSNTICAGACTGLGIAPSKIGNVFGVFKAYCTRVGSGPFPTELTGEINKIIQKAGNEFGATTGRPRRCGWLDLPALRYAIMLNGVTQLIMTKSDVLGNIGTIKICTHYQYNGETIDHLPYNLNDQLIPVYKKMKGWNVDISSLRSIDEIPVELSDYIHFLEEELKVPITIVSVGPDRSQLLTNHL
ncbi:MAG: adenylosuccinate synthase [Bacteroidota bacterium]